METKTQRRIYFPIILALTVFIVWQCILMMGKQSFLPLASSVQAKPLSQTAKSKQLAKATIEPVKSLDKAKELPVIETVNNASIDPMMSQLSSQQLDYLKLVNTYKISQIKRMIAQDNEAIEIANEHAAKAHVTTLAMLSKLDKKSDALYAARRTGLQPIESTATALTKLLYTGKQYGVWNATIKYEGHLNDVVVGTLLSDGAKVVSIDRDTVVLEKEHRKTIISFYNVINNIEAPTNVAVKETKTDPVPVKKVAAKPAPVPVKVAVKPQPLKTAQVRSKSTAVVVKPVTKAVVTKPKVVSVTPKKPLPSVKSAPSHRLVSTIKPQPMSSIKTLSPARIPAKPIVKPLPVLSADERNILQHNPAHYTIQLMANTQRSVLQDYVQAHHLQGKTFIYQTSQHGLPWYVLAYSHFDDREGALKAIRTMSIEQQRYTPFAKKLQVVQQEIRHKQG